MLDATLFSMVPREGYYFSTGQTPERLGNAHYQLSPWNTYETQDGRHIVVVAHTPKYWRALLDALDLQPLADETDFLDNAARLRNRERLDGLLAGAFAKDSLAGWTRRLTAADVLFAPVRNFEEVFSDPAVRDVMVETVSHPTAGDVPVLRNPIRLAANPPSIRLAPPLLGQHTEQILAELERSGTHLDSNDPDSFSVAAGDASGPSMHLRAHQRAAGMRAPNKDQSSPCHRAPIHK
jgi:CoA:oxalate CoA-transferase